MIYSWTAAATTASSATRSGSNCWRRCAGNVPSWMPGRSGCSRRWPPTRCPVSTATQRPTRSGCVRTWRARCASHRRPRAGGCTPRSSWSPGYRRRWLLCAGGRSGCPTPYAQRLVDAVCFLPDTAATEVEKKVLGRAAGQTVAQFAASVRRAVLAADPRGADEQHRDALTQRRVVFTPLDNGMSELWALLPADTAAALQTRIQQTGRRLETPRRTDRRPAPPTPWSPSPTVASPEPARV